MKGPISVTRITADTPLPERHDYELNIRVPMRTYDGELDVESFAFMLNSLMDDWSDGRRPFDIEMIRNGLYRCLKRAAYEVVCKRMQEKFGNEMVGDERRSTAKWLIEADKEKSIVPDFFDSFKVEITEQ
jgi:hypothetical protein